jgi:hypothetical protein
VIYSGIKGLGTAEREKEEFLRESLGDPALLNSDLPFKWAWPFSFFYRPNKGVK